jgi:REP element-mobilizing transposase RayT
MKYDRDKHRRRSIRLRGYDYGRAGAYFVTLCAHDRASLFGEIVDGVMRLNDLGRVVDSEWLKTPRMRPQVELDEYIVMPNHFHAILVVVDMGRGVLPYAPTLRSPSRTVGAIVRGFKSAVTKRINQIRRTPGLPVWQRNYYEHVIRNEGELTRIREYIVDNPSQWALDRENPALGQTNRRGERSLAGRGVWQYAPTDDIETIFGGFRP